jgi:hypothetical protein
MVFRLRLGMTDSEKLDEILGHVRAIANRVGGRDPCHDSADLAAVVRILSDTRWEALLPECEVDLRREVSELGNAYARDALGKLVKTVASFRDCVARQNRLNGELVRAGKAKDFEIDDLRDKLDDAHWRARQASEVAARLMAENVAMAKRLGATGN